MPETATTKPSAASAAVETPHPTMVGQTFMRQYYHFLAKEPASLHRFYKDESRWCHGVGSRMEDAISGQQAINDEILRRGYAGARVDLDIGSIDCQASLHGGVFVLVTGIMTLANSSVPKPFVQTFFLAVQPKGYFVLNDCLRFLELASAAAPSASDAAVTPTDAKKQPAQAAIGTPAAAATAAVASSPVAKPKAVTPVAAAKKTPASPVAKPVETPVSPVKVKSPVKVASPKATTPAPASPVKKAAVSPAPAKTTPKPSETKAATPASPVAAAAAKPATPASPKPAKPAAASPVKPAAPAAPVAPPAPKTWAALFSAGAPAAPSAAPASAAPKGPPAAAAAKPSPASPPPAGPSTAAAGKPAAEPTAAATAAPQEKKRYSSIYIRDVPTQTKESDLRELFKSYGAIANITVPTGRGFAFVDYFEPESMRAVLADTKEFKLYDKVIIVDERTDMRKDKERGGFRSDTRGGRGGGRGPPKSGRTGGDRKEPRASAASDASNGKSNAAGGPPSSSRNGPPSDRRDKGGRRSGKEDGAAGGRGPRAE